MPNQCRPDGLSYRAWSITPAPFTTTPSCPRVEKIHRGMQALFAPSYYQAKREKVPFDAASIASGAGKELGNMGLDLGELLINGVLSGISWPFGTGSFQIDLDRFEYKDAELRGAGLMQAATLAGAAGAVRSAAQTKAATEPRVANKKKASQNPEGENAHSGLHNQAALTPDFETSAESFKTTRQVDMKNLSPEDNAASEALQTQGWDEKKIRQILESGDDFSSKPYKSGDKLYGFNSAGRPRNLDNSANGNWGQVLQSSTYCLD